MKGRRAPLTRDDIERALEMFAKRTHEALPTIATERMPEPTPYERGVLDRYQDGRT